MPITVRFLAVLFVFVLSPAHADQAPPASVKATEAVVQLPIPGTHNSAVFMRLHNVGKTPLTLVGVNTTAAAKAQLHSHTSVDGMMRMRPVESLALAPGQTQVFESGGYHIMLFDVQAELASGDSVDLILEFAGGATKTVQAVAKSRYDNADHSHHH
ncbi:copper chaperone PCu(A)C [uncultured Gilvimarinus sp.]|uniref:copper chaperone PCu(A)C n=1 Tax=uncultured Gilvimarinus sp. TaxID=1689143 RepID=UPI0030D9F804